jgi:hypothetical protein
LTAIFMTRQEPWLLSDGPVYRKSSGKRSGSGWRRISTRKRIFCSQKKRNNSGDTNSNSKNDIENQHGCRFGARIKVSVPGISPETEKLISQRAKSAGTSVNKVVKELLAKALGLGKDKNDHRDEFLDLFGVWTEDDEKQFLEALKDLESVEPGDWR